MQKKPPKNKRVIKTEEYEEDTQTAPIEDMLVASMPIDIKRWISSSGLADLQYTVYVYRCDRRTGSGQRSRKFVNQFDDHIPEFTELGEKYGGGLFELYVRWYNENDEAKSKKLTINIDESWNKIKEEKDRKEELKRGNSEQHNGSFQNSMMSGLMMIRALTEAVSPLISPLINKKADDGNNGNNFAETMKIFQNMGADMLKSNMQSMLENQRFMMENFGGYAEPEEKDDQLERVIGLVAQFLPILKTLSDKQGKQMASTVVKSQPDIQAILSDPNKLQMAYERIKSTHGEEFANRTMRAFGVNRGEGLASKKNSPVIPDAVLKNKAKKSRRAPQEAIG